jgi:asparagine synthase (glutamine-hydrolysing)
MCGITGIFERGGHPVADPDLRRMTDAVAHRGPDGDGYWISGNVGLGHRRLSIIDLSDGGSQPMQSDEGRYIMTYNGELYNYRELRRELQAEGVHFRSSSDSEVVLKAIAKWGIDDAIRRFNGMFAFGLYDREERKLYLARDRFGVKPLYYAVNDNTVLFGSEVKAIFAHPSSRKAIDYQGLTEYLTFQNFFTDHTLYRGVKLLPAGSYAVTMAIGKGEAINIVQYWDFEFEEPGNARPAEDYLEELSYLFEQAVCRQLVADVEVGSYLSGGMDSGSIVAVSSRHLESMRTFTCGFDLRSASGLELSYDEREAAEYMSYLFKTEHYEMVLKAGDMQRVLPRLAYHLEEPRVGQSYPNFYVAQLASKFNKVVLAGTGGDELFGGYPWRYYRAVVNDNFDHYVDKYYDFWQRLIRGDQMREVCAPIWNEIKDISTRDIFKSVFRSHQEELRRPEDYVNHSLYFECKTFLHGLLVVEDKLAMAHGLETRVPFLDNDLVDFAMKLPARHKLGNLSQVVELNENTPGVKTAKYFQKTQDGKLLLRKMMSRLLPDEIVEREKQGFSAPDASWFSGESIDFVRDRLMTPKAKIYDFLDYKAVNGLLDEHLSGKQNRRLLIWSLLNLEQLFSSQEIAA